MIKITIHKTKNLFLELLFGWFLMIVDDLTIKLETTQNASLIFETKKNKIK